MKKLFYSAIFLAILLTGCVTTNNATQKKQPKKEIIVLEDTVFIGDKILDVANTLGVMPKFASARFSQWPNAATFETKKLGCPNRVTQKVKDVVPKLIDEQGVKRIVVEKPKKDKGQYCLLVKKVDPMDIIEIVKGKDVEITVIDFSKGDRDGIIATAKYLGKEAEGKALANKYEKEMKAAKEAMKSVPKGKNVVVLEGIFHNKMKKLFMFAESKGFYTDTIFLEPFGAKNVTDMLNVQNRKIMKGAFEVTSKDLKAMVKANPDIIIVYGNGQKQIKETLAKLAAEDPKFANIPAIKNNKIVNLPYYIGIDIEKGPSIINEWANYFKK